MRLNLHLIVFYIGHALFYIELVNLLLGGGELRFAGLQGQDIALLGVLGYSFFFVEDFQRILFHKWSQLYLAFLGAFSIYGFLNGNDLGWIRTDLRNLLWPYGGIAFYLLLQSSKRPVWHLAVIFAALTCMMHLGKQQAIGHFGQLTVGEDRFYNLSLMGVCYAYLIYLGLLLNHLNGLKKHYWLTIPALLAFTYYGVIITATRNIMMAFAILVGLSIYREWFYGKAIRFEKLFALGLLACLAIPILLQSPAGQRLLDGDKRDKQSVDERWIEILDVSKEYKTYELLFGKGIGSTFQNAINPGTNALHLGVFNIAAKFGLPAFIAFLGFILFVLPLTALNRKDLFQRTQLDKALPFTYTWLLIFLISGGWSTTFFMGVGLNYGSFMTSRNTQENEL